MVKQASGRRIKCCRVHYCWKKDVRKDNPLECGAIIRYPALAPAIALTYTKCSSLILGFRMFYHVSLHHPVIVDLFGAMAVSNRNMEKVLCQITKYPLINFKSVDLVYMHEF
ncbi:MAG: hypothetical protein ACTSRA_20825 [Promethearchaeota archaeon]